MNLNRAQYILTILEEGSISAAARKLYISQAALSQAVRYVEEEIGMPVLERGRGVVKLTYAGERYVETVKQMMLLERSFRNEMNEIKREESGQFRFGISTRNGQRIVPRILPEFLREYPSVKIHVLEHGSAELIPMVLQGDLDVAMVRTAALEKGIVYQLIQKERMGILAGRGSGIYNQYADGTPLDISQTVDERFIFLKRGHRSRHSMDRLLEERKMKLNAMIELDNIDTARQIVINCAGVMVVPFYELVRTEEEKERAHLYPLVGAEDEGSLYLIYNETVYLTSYMKRWMELVKSVY